LRICRVINYLNKRFRHIIISLDGNIDAAMHLSPAVEADILPLPGRKRGILLKTGSSFLTASRALYQIRPDLLMTYNWGSIEWAMVNRIFSRAPHIHFEAGFGKEEADSQLRRRVLYRRWALAHCICIVVPSRQLENIARDNWHMPAEIVSYLPNGIDVERFSTPVRDAVPGFARRLDELIIGTVAPLRPEKNIGRLLRAFTSLDTTVPVRLVIAGDGGERDALERLAKEIGIFDRVVFTGWVSPESVLGSLDVFALSSDTEQMPNAVLEAMAAGLPIAAVDVGDVMTMVSRENRACIVARDDEAAFAAAIGRLLREPGLRQCFGEQNRKRVAAEFSLQQMCDRYSNLLRAAITTAGPKL
jgi:glycosyltransferase involved in cell wall biosynthesis